MWMFIFMILPLLAVVYIGWHVWAILPFSRLWKTVAVILLMGCFMLFFFGLRRQTDAYSLPVAQVLYEVGTSSIFIMLYLVIIFLVLDLGRLVHLVPRSLLFSNWQMALGIFVLVFAVFLYGNIRYNNKVRVPLELTTKKPLPKDYRVVMVSDLHLGYHNTRKVLARWVDIINAEKPDFILIAGDLIDGSIRPLNEERMAEEFHRLQAPVYACLGNHEHFGGDANAIQFYKDAGIHLLMDDVVVVDSSIVIIGRNDRMNRHRKSLDSLMALADVQCSIINGQCYTILLDHQPYDLDLTEKAGIDFQLSGHTHRGQVWPISWITDAIYECSWGSYQRGDTQYYVSSGLGLWGGKFRIGTQSEYIVANIRGEK